MAWVEWLMWLVIIFCWLLTKSMMNLTRRTDSPTANPPPMKNSSLKTSPIPL